MYMSVLQKLDIQPERLAGHEYSFNSDVWSLGLLLMECSLGYYPYQSREYAHKLMLQSSGQNDRLLEGAAWRHNLALSEV
jgi:serine/threonine protein kinase